MPQYNSALEQELKRPERLSVGWPWRLLVFGFIILGMTVASYFGMVFGYTPYLNSQITSLDQKIAGLSQTIDEQQQKKLATFYSQLINVQGLLNSHPAVSKLFDFLEKNTHQNVYYQLLDLSLPEKSLKLEGNASSYNVLSQQLELFRLAPETERVFLDNSRPAQTGEINFSMRVIFKPELLK